jgi:hypothetical protein
MDRGVGSRVLPVPHAKDFQPVWKISRAAFADAPLPLTVLIARRGVKQPLCHLSVEEIRSADFNSHPVRTCSPAAAASRFAG